MKNSLAAQAFNSATKPTNASTGYLPLEHLHKVATIMDPAFVIDVSQMGFDGTLRNKKLFLNRAHIMPRNP